MMDPILNNNHDFLGVHDDGNDEMPRRRYPRRHSVTKFNLEQVSADMKTAAQATYSQGLEYEKVLPVRFSQDENSVGMQGHANSIASGRRRTEADVPLSIHSSIEGGSSDHHFQASTPDREREISPKATSILDSSEDGVARGLPKVCKYCQVDDSHCKYCQGSEQEKKSSTFKKLLKATAKRRRSVRELLGRPNISKAA